jgi:hypothetical protein
MTSAGQIKWTEAALVSTNWIESDLLERAA